MKRVLSLILWILTLLVLVIIIKTLFFKSQQIETETVAMPSFGIESIERLSRAVSYPTISYSSESPVDTTAFNDFLEFIETSFPLVHSSLERESFNKFSLLYRWKGMNASLKPALLLAHYDVVPAGDTAAWERGAFSGYNDGKYVWGRGTLDDKAAMLSILEAVERLLSEGYRPERTLFLSFGHDEEIGGIRGAKTIATALKERGITPEYVIDEGMAVTMGMVPMVSKPVALIGTSEKGYVSVRLSVEMSGGHSSTPEEESALTLLARVVNELNENQMKAEISGPVDDFIRYIGPEMPFYAKAIFANKWIFKKLIISIYSGSASGNALVRTTTAPTIFNSGFMDNVIPATAEAVINFRILPGETSGDVIKHVKKIAGDERIRIEILDGFESQPAPVSPTESAGFGFILKTLRQVYPEALVAPTMMLGASDSKHFIIITDNIYRFAPIAVTSEDMARVHGTDERTGINDYLNGIGFFYLLIKNSQTE